MEIIFPFRKGVISDSTYFVPDYIHLYFLILALCFLPVLVVPLFSPFLIYSYTLTLYNIKFQDVSRSTKLLTLTEVHEYHFLVLLLLFVFLIKSKIKTEYITTFLKFFGRFSVVISLLAVAMNDPFISGVVPNKAMNGVLLVTLLPFIDSFFLTVITACLIATSSSSSAYLSLCVLFLTYGMFQKKRWVYLSLFCVAGVLGVLFVPDALHGTGRKDVWTFFFKFLEPRDYLLGMGPGSFTPFNIFTQEKTGFRMEYGLMYWLHSDPLQLLWEYGIVGTTLFLITAYRCVRHAPRKVLLALSGFCAGSLFYYPFHFAPHLGILFLLLKITANSYSAKQAITNGGLDEGTIKP